MDEFRSFIKVKRNLINLLVLGIIVLSIPIGVALIQQSQNLFLGADQPQIAIESGPCVKTEGNKKVATCTDIPLKLSSPYGGPTPANANQTTYAPIPSLENKKTFLEKLSFISQVVEAADNGFASTEVQPGGCFTITREPGIGNTTGTITVVAPTTTSGQFCTLKVTNIDQNSDCSLNPGTIDINSGQSANITYTKGADDNFPGCKARINIHGSGGGQPTPPPAPVPGPVSAPSVTSYNVGCSGQTPYISIQYTNNGTVTNQAIYKTSGPNGNGQVAGDFLNAPSVNWTYSPAENNASYAFYIQVWNGSGSNTTTRDLGAITTPNCAPTQQPTAAPTAPPTPVPTTPPPTPAPAPGQPTMNITATPDSGGPQTSVTLRWGSSNMPGDAVCTNNWNSFLANNKPFFPPNTSNNSDTRVIGSTFDFTVSCATAGGQPLAQATARFTYVAPATPPPTPAPSPTMSISISPTSGGPDTTVNITWSTSNIPADAICTNNWNDLLTNGTSRFAQNTANNKDTKVMSISHEFIVSCSTPSGVGISQASANYSRINPPGKVTVSLQSAPSCQNNNINVPLTWTAAPGASHYEVWRADNPKGPNTPLSIVTNATSYTDNNPIPTSLIGQRVQYLVVAHSVGGSTVSDPFLVTMPDCRPVSTVAYRLADSQALLGSAPDQPYTNSPTVLNYQIPDIPGTYQIWVQYLNNKGERSTPESVNIELLPKPPVITSVDCRIDITQQSVLFNITGDRLGQKVGNATVKANDNNITINDWTPTKISGVLRNQQLDPKLGQDYRIRVIRTDGQQAPSVTEPDLSCKVGVSQISLGAKLFCRAPSQHDQSNVEITLVSEDGKVIKENVTIDKNGVVQGLNSKLEAGRNYVLSIKSPKGLRRNAIFKSATGTTVVLGSSGSNFILPVGDIFPVDGGDGRINSQDKAELNRQIRLLTAGQNLTADFNLDNRVNSIDYACMRYDFGQADDIVPNQAPANLNGSNPTSTPSATPVNSTSPSPTASSGT